MYSYSFKYCRITHLRDTVHTSTSYTRYSTRTYEYLLIGSSGSLNSESCWKDIYEYCTRSWLRVDSCTQHLLNGTKFSTRGMRAVNPGRVLVLVTCNEEWKYENMKIWNEMGWRSARGHIQTQYNSLVSLMSSVDMRSKQRSNHRPSRFPNHNIRLSSHLNPSDQNIVRISQFVRGIVTSFAKRAYDDFEGFGEN